MKILHLSIFGGHEKRHGGTRRSEQIKEMLEGADCISLNPYLGFRDSFWLSLLNPLMLLSSLLFFVGQYFMGGLSLKGVFRCSVESVNLIKVLRCNAFDIVIHETAPGVSIPFMKYLAREKVIYVAVPHNVEYLVPGQEMDIFRGNYNAYRSEIEGYRLACQVLTICDFDAAILRCSGIPARTLEYRPVFRDLARFASIRDRRNNRSDFDRFLLLGTVDNVPTFNGFKALLDALRNAQPDLCLTVAGYGTEKFKDYQSATVNVLGAVDEAVVESLLCNAKALLINQPQTTGFLTKIVEMNLCGIPQILVGEYYQAKNMERYGVIGSSVEFLHKLKLPLQFEALPELRAEDFLNLLKMMRFRK